MGVGMFFSFHFGVDMRVLRVAHKTASIFCQAYCMENSENCQGR
ncbi:hypothetical protein HMPREF0372_00144 [Flavonifractor plautii ATCC 29863]|uniref:Uncharacterized protein n=1 Tax=Flavonifractor plautii ATCC 29863 TaxID=411475 RepID=G9YKY4_FLAPL|nr:hypothetical protein HMPREF0372_00144 [Flavonifractor plautii ATCC 29863]